MANENRTHGNPNVTVVDVPGHPVTFYIHDYDDGYPTVVIETHSPIHDDRKGPRIRVELDGANVTAGEVIWDNPPPKG
jgi:hypothetical protein